MYVMDQPVREQILRSGGLDVNSFGCGIATYRHRPESHTVATSDREGDIPVPPACMFRSTAPAKGSKATPQHARFQLTVARKRLGSGSMVISLNAD